MALDPKQRRYHIRFFQGLVESVEALGPGDFEPSPSVIRPAKQGIRSIELTLRYCMRDGTEVDIRTSLRLTKGSPPYTPGEELEPVNLEQWERFYHRFHYGRIRGETFFRFDLNVHSRQSPHVHMRPDVKEHVPTTDVTPDTVRLDPREFVKMVAEFRNKDIYPVQRKKR